MKRKNKGVEKPLNLIYFWKIKKTSFIIDFQKSPSPDSLVISTCQAKRKEMFQLQ